MASPNDRRYTQTHEWAKKSSGGSRLTFGITQHNLNQLGSVTDVTNQQPIGTNVSQNDSIGTLTGSSSSGLVTFHAPTNGRIERNEHLLDVINADPYGASSWLVEVSDYDETQYNNLLSAQDYDNLVGGGSGS